MPAGRNSIGENTKKIQFALIHGHIDDRPCVEVYSLRLFSVLFQLHFFLAFLSSTFLIFVKNKFRNKTNCNKIEPTAASALFVLHHDAVQHFFIFQMLRQLVLQESDVGRFFAGRGWKVVAAGVVDSLRILEALLE